MEFKNAHEDFRYKEHIKKKLEDVKDCEEVDLVVEVPKIFRGANARLADGALYLKNVGLSEGRSQEEHELKTNNDQSNDK